MTRKQIRAGLPCFRMPCSHFDSNPAINKPCSELRLAYVILARSLADVDCGMARGNPTRPAYHSPNRAPVCALSEHFGPNVDSAAALAARLLHFVFFSFQSSLQRADLRERTPLSASYRISPLHLFRARSPIKKATPYCQNSKSPANHPFPFPFEVQRKVCRRPPFRFIRAPRFGKLATYKRTRMCASERTPFTAARILPSQRPRSSPSQFSIRQ